MISIGGELALHDELNYFFTDSGRSSLRLFCKNFPGKKVLLPNFLCDVIVEILDQENMLYDFYIINDDLTVNYSSLDGKVFDVFYLINYFGKKIEIPFIINDKIIIEDNVFFIDFENDKNYKYWFSFNSYRKLTELADGSIIKTNLLINDYREKKSAPFSMLKYIAKDIKFNFLSHHEKDEKSYLSVFHDAELVLDNQKKIFMMSDKSLGLLNKLVTEYSSRKIQRQKNYISLLKNFEYLSIDFKSDFYSYFVILTDERDALRSFLFSKNIFLPIHWPSSKGKSHLHKKILSIPLFYNQEETAYLIKFINAYYECS